MAEVHVCHAGTCLNRGAEGVLTEIEELANAVGGQCTVHETGCLGYCSQAPNAVVVRRGERPKVHTLIRSLEASADVVAAATTSADASRDRISVCTFGRSPRLTTTALGAWLQ